MDPLDDVALLQIAVLQQELLERDVEEARTSGQSNLTKSASWGGPFSG